MTGIFGVQRARTIDALLGGIPDNRRYQVYTFLTQVFELVRPGEVRSTLPVARRVIDELHPADTLALAQELVKYVHNHLTYSTIYEQECVGKVPDPEAEYLQRLAASFIAAWTEDHSVKLEAI